MVNLSIPPAMGQRDLSPNRRRSRGSLRTFAADDNGPNSFLQLTFPAQVHDVHVNLRNL